MQDLILVFSPISQLLYATWSGLVSLFYLPFYRSLTDDYCFRSSRPEVFLENDVLKICSKFTGEHPCWSLISIKLLCNFIEIALWHGCSAVNLLHATYFQNTFSYEHLWMAASEFYCRLPGFVTDASCKGEIIPGEKLFVSHELVFELAKDYGTVRTA